MTEMSGDHLGARALPALSRGLAWNCRQEAAL
jgi:hypothetical protein